MGRTLLTPAHRPDNAQKCHEKETGSLQRKVSGYTASTAPIFKKSNAHFLKKSHEPIR